MSTTPNPVARSQIAVAYLASPVIHPDYTYWAHHWEMIRDAEIGEIEVKRKREKYLPKLQGHDAKQYEAYLRRSVFYNMTSKTLNALYGTVFKRNPKVTGFTPALTRASKKFSKDGMSLHLTAKTAVKEVLAIGRYGLLVDASPDGKGSAYTACYTAENILDWHMEEIEGEWKFTRVVLREIAYDREKMFSPYQYSARFRVLVLSKVDDGYVYEQHIYSDNDARGVPTENAVPDDIVIPSVRGETLDYIPFVVIGPFTNHPDVQKPPILDIVTINYSHYLSYAQLEQGRFYTANPVYYATVGQGEGGGEYYVGPDVVWELGQGDKAGIIEFSGSGLKFLENALETKESQIAAIGGRMMPGTSRAAAESDNSLRLKEQNEQTLLLNIADTIDEGFTKIIQWWADWNNASHTVVEDLSFEINRDFLLKDIGAREFRAIHQMYKEGIIPVDVVYEYLRKAEVIPDWMDSTEFLKRLSDANQFPHMVDVLAMMKNFPDAQAFHEYWLLKQGVGGDEVRPSPGDPDMPPVPQQARDAVAIARQREAQAPADE